MLLGAGGIFVSQGGLNNIASGNTTATNISITDIVPKDNPNESFTDIISRFPIQAGLDSIFAGGAELLKWFADLTASGINGLLGFVNGYAHTDIHVPRWFTAFLLFIMAGWYLYTQTMSLLSYGWNMTTMFLALLAMLAAIVFLLIALGFLK